VRFVAITICVASQLVTPKVRVYFVIDLVRKLLARLFLPRILVMRVVRGLTFVTFVVLFI
jgi:hypothetical protein